MAWEIVVKLVTIAFESGRIPMAFAQGILCLIPKAECNKFHGIVLLEVVYKLCATIIHFRLSKAIEFHPGIHGFIWGCGTQMAILEAKLHMQLASHGLCLLFQIFIDLTKAYDTLDHEYVLHILQGYGVGPNLCQLIQVVWDNLLFVPKSAGYYGTPFHPEHGILQGDTDAPIMFAVVVDCILREWICKTIDLDDLIAIFFADDG